MLQRHQYLQALRKQSHPAQGVCKCRTSGVPQSTIVSLEVKSGFKRNLEWAKVVTVAGLLRCCSLPSRNPISSRSSEARLPYIPRSARRLMEPEIDRVTQALGHAAVPASPIEYTSKSLRKALETPLALLVAKAVATKPNLPITPRRKLGFPDDERSRILRERRNHLGLDPARCALIPAAVPCSLSFQRCHPFASSEDRSRNPPTSH